MEKESTKKRATTTKQSREQRLSKIGRYEIVRTIGRGNFAVVKLARHEITHTKVAVKIINKCRIDEENLRRIYREIQILKSLRHPHVIKLYQVMETESKLFLVTEYASGGEVFEYLQKHSRMSEREARLVFRQIVAAVAYCHASGVVHRDLKAENLLFDSSHNIKLVDFGFSNYHHDGTLLQTWCGSPPYAAPELFLGQNYNGTKADAWSLGVVLYILVCGGFPFPSNSMEHLKEAVLAGQITIPFYVSIECSDLIRKLLIVDHAQRYNIRQIIQHRWFCASDWNDEWESLFRLSLEPRFSSSNHNFNHTCLYYMQQHGYSQDKITESVLEQRFDDEYATYTLLYDKLNKPASAANRRINNMLLSDAMVNESTDLTRRGSRGCLTTGQANVEPLADKQTISTADLVKLAHHSPDEETQSSDSEGNAESFSGNIQTYLTQRRHTALGVVGGGQGWPTTAATSTNVGLVPIVPFPLASKGAEITRYLNPTAYFQPPMFDRQFIPHCSYGDRRSSYENRWLSRRLSPFPIPLLCTSETTGSASASTAVDDSRNMEEMGARYLKARGKHKRHTVHVSDDERMSSSTSAVVGRQQYSPIEGYYAGGGGAGAGRHARGSPAYRQHQQISGRRGSDSTQLTPDMLRHLGKLYGTVVSPKGEHSAAESMRQLQQEFTQLRASTEQQHSHPQMLSTSSSDVWRSPRSSPSGQSLHMIVEDDGGGGGFTSSSSLTAGRVKHCSMSACENIIHPTGGLFSNPSIRLESAVPTPPQPPPPMEIVNVDVATNAGDPLENFQRFASGLLSTTSTSPSTCGPFLDTYYYSSYPSLQQQQQQNVYRSPKKEETVLSSRTISFISLQLRRVLSRMKIQYKEETAPTSTTDDSAGNSRRVSLESDDGTIVEIGVSPAGGNATGMNKVDFRCVEGDYDRYQELCSAVLAGLNL